MDDQITTVSKPSGTAAKATGGGVQQSLETMKSERHVWLMKCPPIVSRSLTQKQSESSTDSPIGAKVVVTVDPLLPNNDFSSTQFTMELLGTESGRVPKCYSMDMSTDFIPMSVFSESKQGRVSVEGKIYHKFDMKPHNENMEEYGKLCRERTNKYMTKTRQIQVIDNDKGAHMRPMPGLIPIRPLSQNEKRKTPVKGSDTKRTRRDRGEMEDIMFKLFERQSNWTLKHLISETDQPEQFLKDLLKDLCIYNNKGSNQGTYELKPEYKRSTEEQEQEQEPPSK
ncbi:putative DNA helicase [Helianthus annuus]|uniref:general transcription factor IIF subunit 2 isoform X2 n=1 Tax=Helianthus annuus TaxID=4232 RepID=UPI000B8F2E18|nr:general transcription factor IIF subunit 2 isoform X2 [Helianthus annuus]KAJ0538296.1 putative DNA helicase [Helianthus annuus]KAJ0552922.1 putative DNA helicase [Helianthus annuus]KAJ0721846.1 putative DNA helicase [Helianthus annuus]